MSQLKHVVLKLTNGLDIVAEQVDHDTFKNPMFIQMVEGPNKQPMSTFSPFTLFTNNNTENFKFVMSNILSVYEPDPKWVEKYIDSVSRFRAHRAGILLSKNS